MATISELRAKWKSEGRCTGCAAPKELGKACKACLGRQRKKRERRKQSGLCSCGKRPERKDRKSCNKCLKRMSAAVAAEAGRRRKAGLCISCGTQLTKEKKTDAKCLKCREVDKAYRKKNKQLVMAHYGQACRCCGEGLLEFLTIDHIDGDGAAHRKATFSQARAGGNTMYRWLIKNQFPDGFQTLCFNCNIGRYYNEGICPHKR